MKIPNINEIPKEERDKRNEKCRVCDTRKWYARRLDFHFDWWDCPYNCPNDLEHLMRKMDEEDKSECVVGCDGYCEECPIGEEKSK